MIGDGRQRSTSEAANCSSGTAAAGSSVKVDYSCELETSAANIVVEVDVDGERRRHGTTASDRPPDQLFSHLTFASSLSGRHRVSSARLASDLISTLRFYVN